MGTDNKATAVAKTTERQRPALSPEREAQIAEARARTEVAKAIRSAVWGKELHPTVMQAVVAYCRQNNLDAVRHVEVLGGRIYLTAALYDEKGAHLLYSGDVVFEEPDYVNADARLDELVKSGDAWAVEEKQRRLRERIKYNVPETARAAVVQRAKLRSGMVAVGVNWCGAPGGKKDPVGDAEPTKTAQTRARRRCWVQLAEILPNYGATVKPLQESAKTAVPVAVVEAEQAETREHMKFGGGDDPYMIGAGEAQGGEELLREDRELVEREREPGEE